MAKRNWYSRLRKSCLSRQNQNKTLLDIAWMQSHQVGAPRANIMGLVQLLDSIDPGGSEVLSILQKIRLAALELDRVIREMTAYADQVVKQYFRTLDRLQVHNTTSFKQDKPLAPVFRIFARYGTTPQDQRIIVGNQSDARQIG